MYRGTRSLEMALERFLNLPEERRATILRTAAAVFAEHGYEKTSYNELLRQLGMGKSQAYYYFADKADLFITAIAAAYENFYLACADYPEPTNAEEFWNQMEELHLLGFQHQIRYPESTQLMLAALESSVRFQLADALMNGGSSREQHRYWVKQGQQLGAVRTDLQEELLVEMSMNQAFFVDEWFARHFSKYEESDLADLAREFCDVSKRMFQP